MVRIGTVGRNLGVVALAGLTLAQSASLAFAHHAMGGQTPNTFATGFMSGLAHPVIGFDHLAFVVAAGIASAFLASRLLLPALFVAATVVGCLLSTTLGLKLPMAEMVIAASVLVVGAVAMSGRAVDARILGALFLVAGLFHGGAYGESIVGAEATPLVAYLAGFGLVQFAVMAGAAWAARAVSKAATSVAVEPRLAGAVAAGVGATFLLEHVEKLVFPGL